MSADQGELFSVPGPPKPYRKAAAGPVRPRYARYRSMRRVLCDDCICDIHTRGVAVAPFPNSARWRRTDQDGVLRLCDRHRAERIEAGS